MNFNSPIYRCLTIDQWNQVSVQRDDNYRSYYHLTQASINRIMYVANRRPSGIKVRLHMKAGERGITLRLVSIRSD